MTNEKIPIYISKDLYEKIDRRVKTNQDLFKSVGEYVIFVLEEVVKETNAPSRKPYTPEEEETIKERLRSLGYL